MRFWYALAGAVVAIILDLAVNLLAAVIQARTPAEQFASMSVGWLLAVIAAGLLIGLWLGGMVTIPTTQPRPAKATPDTVQITRLRALLSYGRLRGQGISLSDILLVGSVLDIDTRDGHK